MEGVPQYLVRDLRSALLAKRFVPFTLVMKDGERYEVRRKFACGFAGDLIFMRLPGRSVRERLHNVAAVEVGQSVGGA